MVALLRSWINRGRNARKNRKNKGKKNALGQKLFFILKQGIHGSSSTTLSVNRHLKSWVSTSDLTFERLCAFDAWQREAAVIWARRGIREVRVWLWWSESHTCMATIHHITTTIHHIWCFYQQLSGNWGGCGSGGRAGRPLIGSSAVWILATPVPSSKCPWARHWAPHCLQWVCRHSLPPLVCECGSEDTGFDCLQLQSQYMNSRSTSSRENATHELVDYQFLSEFRGKKEGGQGGTPFKKAGLTKWLTISMWLAIFI